MRHTHPARAIGCPETVTVRLAFAGHEGHGQKQQYARDCHHDGLLARDAQGVHRHPLSG